MLKNLFISKVRIKLLEQFLFNPEQEYHIRGLVRILDEEINAIRRELMNLKDAGVLKAEKMGNRVVYSINPKCTIIHELRSMLYKDSDTGQLLTKAAYSIKGMEMAILTKSFMDKKYESGIDIDVLFVGTIDIRKLSAEMKEVERVLNREIKYSAITMQDFEFGKKKRTAFLMNILDKDMILLIGNERALKM
jgi:DNA-binding transcriptional ArsR family regulator